MPWIVNIVDRVIVERISFFDPRYTIHDKRKSYAKI